MKKEKKDLSVRLENMKNNKKLHKLDKNIDFTIKSIDKIMHTKIILAIFMIIDGINYILHPDRTIYYMSRTVAQDAFLAAATIIITFISTKNRDIKSLTTPILMLIVSGIIFLFPNTFTPNIRLILGIFIILNGIINILNIKKIDRVGASLKFVEKKFKNDITKIEKVESEDKDTILKQTKKIIDPFKNVLKYASKYYYLYLILNIITIILGLLLLFNDTTIVVCGFIFIYTGIFEVLMFINSFIVSSKKKKIEKNER